jgi:hypothetical protein
VYNFLGLRGRFPLYSTLLSRCFLRADFAAYAFHIQAVVAIAAVGNLFQLIQRRAFPKRFTVVLQQVYLFHWWEPPRRQRNQRTERSGTVPWSLVALGYFYLITIMQPCQRVYLGCVCIPYLSILRTRYCSFVPLPCYNDDNKVPRWWARNREYCLFCLHR